MGQVYIGKILEVSSIPEADRIECAIATCNQGGRWTGVIEKNVMKVNDLCEVYLQDSLLPQDDPRFAFMEKHKYRIRIQRMRGVPSECLIMPLIHPGYIGDDITEVCRVTKYEKPMPAAIAGEVVGAFPSFIPKTDEVNFQAAPLLVDALRGQPFYSSEKEDGSSGTVFWYNTHFGCCSRTLELKEFNSKGVSPAVWQIARQYDHEKHLTKLNLGLQFEIVGPGIQGNPRGLKKVEPRLFDVFEIDKHEYFSPEEMIRFAQSIQMPTVNLLEIGNIFPEKMTDEDLRKYAEGLYPNGRQREGVVFRNCGAPKRVRGSRLSFKVINLLYKEK